MNRSEDINIQDIQNIRDRLLNQQNEKNKNFICSLALEIDPGRVLGCKAPEIKAIAKAIPDDLAREYIQNGNHEFYEEDILHIYLLNILKDEELVKAGLEAILPAVNTWALSDICTLNKLPDKTVLAWADEFLDRKENIYIQRIGMLWILKRGLGKNYPVNTRLVQKALEIKSSQQALQAMQAWMLCEGMVKNPDVFLDYIETSENPVRRMAIQKCIDSRRIPAETKSLLKTMRR